MRELNFNFPLLKSGHLEGIDYMFVELKIEKFKILNFSGLPSLILSFSLTRPNKKMKKIS